MSNIDYSTIKRGILFFVIALIPSVYFSMAAAHSGAFAGGFREGGWNIHLLFSLPVIKAIGFISSVACASASLLLIRSKWIGTLVAIFASIMLSWMISFLLFRFFNSR